MKKFLSVGFFITTSLFSAAPASSRLPSIPKESDSRKVFKRTHDVKDLTKQAEELLKNPHHIYSVSDAPHLTLQIVKKEIAEGKTDYLLEIKHPHHKYMFSLHELEKIDLTVFNDSHLTQDNNDYISNLIKVFAFKRADHLKKREWENNLSFPHRHPYILMVGGLLVGVVGGTVLSQLG